MLTYSGIVYGYLHIIKSEMSRGDKDCTVHQVEHNLPYGTL